MTGEALKLLLLTRTLLVTKGIATRSKDATRGSWPYYYWEQGRYSTGIARQHKTP